MNSFENMLNVRRSGDVKRFHTMTMHREHLVASHAWGVALLCDYINPDVSSNILRAALYHDTAEVITGDVSAPTKWDYPEIADALFAAEVNIMNNWGVSHNLSTGELRLLKLADMADLLLACLEELELGNRNIVKVLERGVGYIQKMEIDEYSYFVSKLLNHVFLSMEKANGR